MILNEFGQIAYDEWIKLTDRFNNVDLDVFQIMPNHMHGIIVLNNPIGATLAVAPNDANVAIAVAPNDANIAIAVAPNDADLDSQNDIQNGSIAQNDSIVVGAGASPAPTTVSDIVGAYKSLVAIGCLNIYKSKNETMGKLWQRNYYEHIIRNQKSYHAISKYIINNPSKWDNDIQFSH